MDKHYSEIYVHELEKEIAELKAEVERLKRNQCMFEGYCASCFGDYS